ncbi:hypothetical protein F2Q69_00034905 [Brassica cretica]|uniref:Uncharacterized protein n=1 Tax=Brassica cretica TaxID=69181 RepID=A0A8S9SDJ2_BRACR|nr:hypothetical protein F2Q69_00034905 [Brassica cretica]
MDLARFCSRPALSGVLHRAVRVVGNVMKVEITCSLLAPLPLQSGLSYWQIFWVRVLLWIGRIQSQHASSWIPSS